MLFYDGNPKKDFICKVAKASYYFKRKYGRMPDICIVNPADLEKLPIEPPNKIKVLRSTLTVYTWNKMLKGCFGICLDGQPVRSQPKPESPADAFVRHAQKVDAQ